MLGGLQGFVLGSNTLSSRIQSPPQLFFQGFLLGKIDGDFAVSTVSTRRATFAAKSISLSNSGSGAV
jgi:hypothetical protein